MPSVNECTYVISAGSTIMLVAVRKLRSMEANTSTITLGYIGAAVVVFGWAMLAVRLMGGA